MYLRSSIPVSYSPIPAAFLCSFSREIMTEPVMSMCGHFFEKNVFQKMLSCPIDNSNIDHQKCVNFASLKGRIEAWKTQNGSSFPEGEEEGPAPKVERKMRSEVEEASNPPKKSLLPPAKTPLGKSRADLEVVDPHVFYERGDFQSALLGFQQSLSKEKQKPVPNDKQLLFLMRRVSRCLRELGDFRQALGVCKEIFDRVQKSSGSWKDLAEALNDIGICHQNLSEYDQAIAAHSQSLAFKQKISNHFDRQLKTFASSARPRNRGSTLTVSAQSSLKKQKNDSIRSITASLNNMGNCLRFLGRVQEALKHHQQALKLNQEIGTDVQDSLTRPLNNIGNCFSILGNFEEASGYFERVYVILSDKYPEQLHPEIVRILNSMGRIASNLEQYQRALNLYKNALWIGRRVYHGPHVDIAYSLNGIGQCFNHLGFFSNAVKYSQEALTMQGQIPEGRHSTDSRNFSMDVALGFENMGRTSEALEKHKEAAVYEESFSEKNKKYYSQARPDFADALVRRGECSRKLGQYHEAMEFHKKAVQIQLDLFGRKHPHVADSYDHLGICHYSLGLFREASRCHEQALDIRGSLHRSGTFKFGQSLTGQGNALAALGHVEQGLSVHQEALRVKKATLQIIHPSIAESLVNIASCLSLLNRQKESLEYYRQSFAMRCSTLGSQHPETLLSSQSVRSCELFLQDRAEVLDTEIESIGKSSFIDLIKLAKSCLVSKDSHLLKFVANPTGFVRIHLPIPKSLSDKMESIRLNYWPLSFKVKMVEAQHTHPCYFESLILAGGYTHAVFKKSEEGIPFRAHRMFKNVYKERNIFFQGIVRLARIKEESTKRDSFQIFPRTLVHQVLSTKPGTLSLNCVYKSRDHNFFDVYVEKSSFEDPQVEREVLSSEDASTLVKEILPLIDAYLSPEEEKERRTG